MSAAKKRIQTQFERSISQILGISTKPIGKKESQIIQVSKILGSLVTLTEDTANALKLEFSKELTEESPQRILRAVESPLLVGQTENPLALVVQGKTADAEYACQQAREFAPQWAKTSYTQRVKVLRKLAALVEKHYAALLDLISVENGKARVHAQDELADVVLNARFLAKTAAKTLRPEKHRGLIPFLTRVHTEHCPEGVVGVIAPWNYPFTLALSDALAALAAGNVVVIKPATATPLCALVARYLLLQAGLPPLAFQVVTGAGSQIGQVLTAACDHVMFTGSSAVGKQVAAQAGENIIPISAELGGKNPLLVLPGAPIKRAVQGTIAACFASSGQLCVSVERIYVHKEMWDKYVPALVKAVKKLKLRADLSWKADLGPLNSISQLETVQAHVEDALTQGATILAGGKAVPQVAPTAYLPTLLTGVPKTAQLYRQETFGPVVAIYRVESVDEAVAQANDTVYGLNAVVWGPTRLARKVAAQIEAGSVNINDGYSAAWGSNAAPLGGWKESGLGRRHGIEGLLGFTRTRTVAQSRFWPLVAPPFLTNRSWGRIMKTYTHWRGKAGF